MSLIVFGLNHKSAPVAIREQFAHLKSARIPAVNGSNLEAVPICTCNRVEVYYSGSIEEALSSFKKLLKSRQLDYENLKKYFYELKDKDAINHIFSVASGIDSMVLGENQILHQIKEAYKNAVESEYVGKSLHNLFQKTLEVGKKVRSQTAISANRVSIASAAVDLAKSIFKDLSGLKAMIIGAGEMASLVAVHMKENGVQKMSFLNRTKCKALEISEKFNGEACSFDKLNDLLCVCDIVISSTSAPHQIITSEQALTAASKRNGTPLFMIDIAVPRDIEPECRNISNVFLYDIDDLKNVVNESLIQRTEEAKKAEQIVKNETNEFISYIDVYNVVPKIKEINEQAEQLRNAELNKFFLEHSDLTEEIKSLFEQYSRQLMAKWLHTKIEELKNKGETDTAQFENFTEIIGLSQQTLNRLKKNSMRNIGAVRQIA